MGTALAFPSVPAPSPDSPRRVSASPPWSRPPCTAPTRLPGLRPGTGLTVVTWLMRVGFLVSPLIVGVVADATSLRVGLLIVPVAGSGGGAAGRRAQWTTRANSIVRTPATMSPMPAIIFHVNGSLKRYRAITATQRDAARRPDAVGDAHRHPESQRQPQQIERRQVADHDGCDPRLLAKPVGRPQRQRGEHLDGDRAQQRQPHGQGVGPSASGCEPSSTSSTPAMISAMPAAMAQVSGSRKRAAPSTAVRAVPIAPQMP